MRLIIDRLGDEVAIVARHLDDLTDLRVVIGDVGDDRAARAVEEAGLGELHTDHAWLDPVTLAARGPDTAAWRRRFAAMLLVAEAHGWTRATPPGVRAHVVRRSPSATTPITTPVTTAPPHPSPTASGAT